MDEAIRQLMMQMQMRRMMESMPGGNQLPDAVRRSIMTQPSFGEGDVMPPTASRVPGYEAYGAEIGAAQGQAQRDQDLHDALRMRGFGSTIPTVEAQQNSMFGTPISDTFLQRPPLAPGFEAASPAQAWFENPPWLQGEPPESYGRIMGPYPGPSGLSGDYSRGKLFGPQSPLRGTVRQSFPF